MATAVWVLCSRPALSAAPAPAWVMVSSVVSGRISLTEPTRVVLPTPKPPTITIFTAVEADAGRASSLRGPTASSRLRSEPLKSMHHRLKQFTVGKECGRDGGACLHPFGGQQVGEQDGDHAHRQGQVGGDLRDRERRG